MKQTMFRTNPQDFSCQKYWHAIKKQVSSNKQHYEKPSLFDYNAYNYALLSINESDKELVKLGDLDLSFKLFEPSKKKYVMWRGVTNLYCQKNRILKDYFNKCKNIKPGEILYLKEFPYVSCERDFAKSYILNLKDNENILFEIKIPKGTRFLNNGFRSVLPRCSKFLCTDTRKIKEKETTYQHIKLTLLPKDIQQESELKENFIQKILSFVGRFY